MSSLHEPENAAAFTQRHIGPDEAAITQMLRTVGHDSLDSLSAAIVPTRIGCFAPLNLPAALDEMQALEQLRQIAEKNKPLRSFIGQGYYGTHTPPVILRNILQNPAWYTAYTPYQAEISQGRMEALITFQQVVSDLTGMDIANASLLDEATAAAEAMTLAKRSSKSKSAVFFVQDTVHPQTLELLRTRAEPLGIALHSGPAQHAASTDCFAVLLQYPDTFGHIDDYRKLVTDCHARGIVVAVATDLLALTLLTPPGEWGADIVIGNSQRFGVPMGYGGPHAGFMACRDAYKRSMPGRLIGVSKDAAGNPAYRLTLQTREQHIRREKATSNICTAQVLLAVMAGMYAVWHGPQGLQHIARRVHQHSARLAGALRNAGIDVADHFFDTLHLRQLDAPALQAKAVAAGFNLRLISDTALGISLDETTTDEDVARLAAVFGAVIDKEQAPCTALPAELQRRSAFLTHPVFSSYHSEHAMLRYLRRLSDKDLAMDRGMIALGSCTMKLNATAEMIPITWSEFANIHPFVPPDQATGYQQLVTELEALLAECTGYDAVSFQPNSGAQGEYAGLMAIRRYHAARGESQRDICLIPSSAHGTNPASAQLSGMKVIVTACDANGNVDVEDIRVKAQQYAPRLAAIMLTYPSTHGVFEENVVEICEIIHQHGGQVYTDGANLNALVGLAKPGVWGSDVSHLNLHKTFCIPHGGGGPGVGPCAVKAHLAPFLPGTRAADNPHAEVVGRVSAADFGSASILPISWMYIRLMGESGLRKATQVALLAANYVAKRLEPHYKILYSGRNGLVAHECIVDIRPLEKTSGISAEDIAKRLMDYGFHAPTLSFPVAGTLMIEPTESEPLPELERFIEAMISIRQEIAAIESGQLDRLDNPLKYAPHTVDSVCADAWDHAYSRQQAAFPVPSLRQQKYWPPVSRVDNVHGDKNVFCACIPVELMDQSATV